jgi:hypothetical protein
MVRRATGQGLAVSHALKAAAELQVIVEGPFRRRGRRWHHGQERRQQEGQRHRKRQPLPQSGKASKGKMVTAFHGHGV